MKRIYKHVENLIREISDKYNITYQGYSEDEPNSLGIFLYESRNDNIALSGEVQYECLKLQIEIVSENNEDAIFENMQFIREFVDSFEESGSTVDGLDIEWAEHLGAKSKPPFKNGYNLQICSCTIDFNYNFD